eukprot:gene1287-21859_t
MPPPDPPPRRRVDADARLRLLRRQKGRCPDRITASPAVYAARVRDAEARAAALRERVSELRPPAQEEDPPPAAPPPPPDGA